MSSSCFVRFIHLFNFRFSYSFICPRFLKQMIDFFINKETISLIRFAFVRRAKFQFINLNLLQNFLILFVLLASLLLVEVECHRTLSTRSVTIKNSYHLNQKNFINSTHSYVKNNTNKINNNNNNNNKNNKQNSKIYATSSKQANKSKSINETSQQIRKQQKNGDKSIDKKSKESKLTRDHHLSISNNKNRNEQNYMEQPSIAYNTLFDSGSSGGSSSGSRKDGFFIFPNLSQSNGFDTNGSLESFAPMPLDVNVDEVARELIIKIILSIFYIFICVSCILGNILVILSVFTYKPLQSVQNIFIVSLAVADTLVACIVMPFHIILHIVDGQWLFGAFLCHFFITSDILLCTASVLHLCCIALDRYWAIKDSIKYAQKRTLKRVLFMILIVWISSAFISLPGIFWNSKIIGYHPSDSSSSSSTSVAIAAATTPSTAPVLSDESASRLLLRRDLADSDEQYTFVCDISRELSYRVYSSCGTFWIPLLIMTFVYVQIYLETKRRLHERAKAAKKLANSLANSQRVKEGPPLQRGLSNNLISCIFCRCKTKNCMKHSDKEGEEAGAARKSGGSRGKRKHESVFTEATLDNEQSVISLGYNGEEARKSNCSQRSQLSKIPESNSQTRRLVEDEARARLLQNNDANRLGLIHDESLSLNKSNFDSEICEDVVYLQQQASPNSAERMTNESAKLRNDSVQPNNIRKGNLKPCASETKSLKKTRYSLNEATGSPRTITPTSSNKNNRFSVPIESASDEQRFFPTKEIDSDQLSALNQSNSNYSFPNEGPGGSDKVTTPVKDPDQPATTMARRVTIGTNTASVTASNNNNNNRLKVQPTAEASTSFNDASTQMDTNRVDGKQQWNRNAAVNSGLTLKQRQKISLTRERRAARTLGIIMGSFTFCWCPFFVVYLLQSFDFKVSDTLNTILTWLGYVNSALNPVIYTVFNLDFRKSFKRLLFGCILFKNLRK